MSSETLTLYYKLLFGDKFFSRGTKTIVVSFLKGVVGISCDNIIH